MLELFEGSNVPDIGPVIGRISSSLLPEKCLSVYRRAREEYQRAASVALHCENVMGELEKEKEELSTPEAYALSEELIQAFQNATEALNFTGVVRQVEFKEVRALYEKHQQRFDEKKWYRHKMVFHLLTSLLYFERPKITERFMAIDEAQDISVIEYKLLRRILGPTCTFELYGDVSQSVYCYKGIKDWEDISFITGDHIHVLQENYRNTLQITKYCN